MWTGRAQAGEGTLCSCDTGPVCGPLPKSLLWSKGRGMGRIIPSGSAEGWLGRAPHVSKPFPPHSTEVHGEPAGTHQPPAPPPRRGHPRWDAAGPRCGDSSPGRRKPSRRFGQLSVFYADGGNFCFYASMAGMSRQPRPTAKGAERCCGRRGAGGKSPSPLVYFRQSPCISPRLKQPGSAGSSELPVCPGRAQRVGVPTRKSLSGRDGEGGIRSLLFPGWDPSSLRFPLPQPAPEPPAWLWPPAPSRLAGQGSAPPILRLLHRRGCRHLLRLRRGKVSPAELAAVR